MKQFITGTLALALSLLTAGAAVRPSAMVSDHMVLQQNTDARLWGKARPGASVTATASWGATATARANASGAWSLRIATPGASYTPHTITLTDGDGEPATISDVLIGEVWLASGQSNMEMPLKGFPGCCVDGGYDEIASSRSRAGSVRFINVPLTQSYQPVDTINSRWTTPSPETAPDYSALAWHYACRMADVLDLPVGIVSAAYGGARVESWMPREILETYPDVSLDPKDVEAMVHYRRPLLMYNAMFHPIKDYTYRGIIWYQGCSNVSTYQTYADRLATMVAHWRSEIGEGDIPFYAVEIAPYDYDDPEEQGRAPFLRLAQWDAVSRIPNSDMISINDLVKPHERHNIHPADKASVGPPPLRPRAQPHIRTPAVSRRRAPIQRPHIPRRRRMGETRLPQRHLPQLRHPRLRGGRP